MRDHYSKYGIQKKNFKKIGLIFGAQGNVKKSKKDDISAPASNLA